jgi:GH25 family lysozyme M1 (1,4-beta-N-acetylmuramidase)
MTIREEIHHIGRDIFGSLEGTKHMLTMQDISNWQGPKAPEHVAKNEILAIKASEGNNFLDPDFANNWKFAKDNEKGRIAYHLLHPSQPALQQATFFLDYVDKAGIETGDMFAIDLEQSDGLDPKAVDECADMFCSHVNSITKSKPFVYTYIYFAQAGNCASLGDLPLWIADPSHAPAHPEVPGPWKDWVIHQYGVFRGIDADVVNVNSLDQLAQYGALIGNPAPPPNIVTLHLSDPKAETTKEYDEHAPIGTLRGLDLTAGDATLKFI